MHDKLQEPLMMSSIECEFLKSICPLSLCLVQTSWTHVEPPITILLNLLTSGCVNSPFVCVSLMAPMSPNVAYALSSDRFGICIKSFGCVSNMCCQICCHVCVGIGLSCHVIDYLSTLVGENIFYQCAVLCELNMAGLLWHHVFYGATSTTADSYLSVVCTGPSPLQPPFCPVIVGYPAPFFTSVK